MSNSESGGGGEKLGGSEGGEGGVVKDCVRSDAKRG